MHSRATTWLVFSVELEKRALTKILPRRSEMCAVFNYGEWERPWELGCEEWPTACDCTHEEKTNSKVFTEIGCYGNQLQPFEVLFCTIHTNSSCSFTNKIWFSTKHILQVSVSFYAICNKRKFWQLIIFSPFYRLYFGANLVKKLSSVTWHADVKMLLFF